MVGVLCGYRPPVYWGGAIVGVLSVRCWLFRWSVLSGRAFVDVLAKIIDFPFDYLYSTSSVGLWLAIVVVLSLFASWLPARRATQISVRGSLAYEEAKTTLQIP